MKYTLTITDMSSDEFAELFANINCRKDVKFEPVVSESDIPVQASEETVNFDKDGLPWDARIHSSNHKINSDGRWQRRRGVSDVEFNNVRNELLGVAPVITTVTPMGEMSTIATPAPEPTPVVAPQPLTPPMGDVSAPMSYPNAPVATPVTTPEIDSAILYQTMFEKLKIGMAQKKVAPNDIQALLNAVNVQFQANYQGLASIKDNIPAMQFVINDLTARGL